MLSAVFGGLSAIVGAWFAFATRLTRVEEKVTSLTNKMDDLSENVSKHNEVIERTFKLEERMEGALHSIDEVKGEIRHYHHN